jgi:hypothetical protein
MSNPSTGPLDRETLLALANAPFGKAKEVIREHDPQWGRGLGEKFEWKIAVRRDGADRGVAYLKASCKEEAEKLAYDLTTCDIEWDYDDDGFFIESIEPAKVK